MRQQSLGVGALAAATLLLESALLRLMAVAQSYHFAFLVISLALLGFGASGSWLELAGRRQTRSPVAGLAGCGAAFSISIAAAYAVANWLPFDSYTLAWQRRQIAYLLLYYLALALPFFFSGLGIATTLAGSRGVSHIVYAANLLGSALGALLGPPLLALGGVPAAALASALLGLVPLLVCPRWRLTGGLVTVAGLAGLCLLAAVNAHDAGPLGLVLSPYKGLTQAARYPGASLLFGRWNAVERVDVLAQAGIHHWPGLSYAYPGDLPPQSGLSLDAEAPQPITLAAPDDPVTRAATSYLPEAVAFTLRPGAQVLVIEPGGGLGVLQSLTGGAASVTATLNDPLVRRAVARADPVHDVYAQPGVHTVTEAGRVYLRHPGPTYDIVFLPLTDAYRPVTNGAFSLSEDYDLTVEALTDALHRLKPGGLLLVTRWLQTPPSESLRLVATLVEALARQGVAPAQALVAYRSIQTISVLVQPAGWSAAELATLRAFLATRRYDMIWAPDVQSGETNHFNRLPAPADYLAVRDLLNAPNRTAFYAGYPFAIQPTTDDHPFFFHFFKWQQTPAVLASLGHTWEPFAGSGYLLLLLLLAMVLVLSAGLILLPLWVRGRSPTPRPQAAGAAAPAAQRWTLCYFGLLGLGFLFVEIPLIQRWMLLVGHATYAFAAVVLTLLACSSVGSRLARAPWLPARAAMIALALLSLLTPSATGWLADATLAWPTPARVTVAVLSLAPLALLMGLPFPLGLARSEARGGQLVPWAWAVNGCASVVASVLAALLALELGFTAVLLLGAGTYAAAAALYVGADRRPISTRP